MSKISISYSWTAKSMKLLYFTSQYLQLDCSYCCKSSSQTRSSYYNFGIWMYWHQIFDWILYLGLDSQIIKIKSLMYETPFAGIIHSKAIIKILNPVSNIFSSSQDNHNCILALLIANVPYHIVQCIVDIWNIC